MRLSLRHRLFILTGAALLPAVIVLAINAYQSRLERIVEVREQALRQGKLASLELERILDGVQNVLVAASAAKEVTNRQPEACSRYLAEVAGHVPALNAIGVAGLDGRTFCNSVPDVRPFDLKDRAYFDDAVRTGLFTVGVYSESKTNGRAVLPVALALKDSAGQVSGLIVTAIQLEWLGAQLRARGLTRGGALTVADRNGVILFRDPFPERFVGTEIPSAFKRLLTAPEPGTLDVVSQDGTARIIGYYPLSETPAGLYVSAGVSKAEAFASLNRATLTAIALMLLGATAAFLLADAVGRRMVQLPMNRLTDTIGDWKRGELKARSGFKPDGNEFSVVGTALDGVMDELQLRAEQRELAARELAHRVKNTLSIVQAIANQTFKDAGGESLRTFSNRLASLASAYDVLLTEERTGGDIRDALETTLEPHRDNADRLRLDGPSIVLPAQIILSVSMVVHELATNALKYGALSKDHGYVNLVWSLLEENQSRVRLTWSEHDGPIVVPPQRNGFGSKLIRHAFASGLNPIVAMSFDTDGLRCTIEFDCIETFAPNVVGNTTLQQNI